MAIDKNHGLLTEVQALFHALKHLLDAPGAEGVDIRSVEFNFRGRQGRAPTAEHLDVLNLNGLVETLNGRLERESARHRHFIREKTRPYSGGDS
ncbi:hypothetical protein D3C72_1038100 [compost metagenome]